MEWDGGEIGWRDGSSQQVTHPLNGSSNSSDIGCLYSETYSAIVYRLHSTCDFHEFTCYNGGCTSQTYVCDQINDCGDYSDEDGCGYRCLSYQFTCDNGDCIHENYRCDNYNDCGDYSDEGRCGATDHTDSYYCSSYQLMCDNGNCYYESYKCDGYNDCGDNSDEEGCATGTDVNVGLAVGLSVGGVFLILVIGVPLCIVMGVYCLSRRSNLPVRTRIVATAPSPGATTLVTSSQAETATAAPVQYQEQPVYKDTQFSNQDAPPSYTDATAYPQAAPGYNQYQPTPAAAYPQQQNTSYPPQNPAYPQAVPYSNQAYPPPNLLYPPA